MSRLTPSARLYAKPPCERLTWVDVAKGASIILVVLNHAVAALASNGWGLDSIGRIDAALTTFRMPLFFFASGMFFAGNLALPWSGFMRNKVSGFLYLYALWSVLLGVFFWLLPWVQPVIGPWQDVALILVYPSSHLWFIYALPLFFVVTRLLNTLPMAVQAPTVATVTIVYGSGFALTGSWAWDAMLSYYGFFFAAVHFRGLALLVAERSSWRLMIACAVLWAGAITFAYLSNLLVVSPLRVPASILAVTGGVILAAKLSSTLPGRWLSWIGKRTLPVYLLHVPVVMGLAHYLPSGYWIPALAVHVAPFIITAIAIAVSLWIWFSTKRVPGLYSAPWVLR